MRDRMQNERLLLLEVFLVFVIYRIYSLAIEFNLRIWYQLEKSRPLVWGYELTECFKEVGEINVYID